MRRNVGGHTVRFLCLVIALGSAAGFSQAEIPGADIEQMWLDPSARGSLFVGNGQTLPQRQVRLAASMFLTFGNLRSYSDTTPSLLVRERLGIQIAAAVGVTSWFELGAILPVQLFQQGSQLLALAPAGLGNPFVTTKINIIADDKPVAVAFGLAVGLPVGTSSAQGNGGIEFVPRVQLGHVSPHFQWGAELGLLYRPTVDFSIVTLEPRDKVGTQVWLAGTVTSVNQTGPRGEVSVRAYAPLTGGTVGVEGQVGVRFPLRNVELFVSGGPGFAGEPTTPLIRVYAGAAFGNGSATMPSCVEGQTYEIDRCPLLDKDGDGIRNEMDHSPLHREDFDGFRDDDGEPDLDNDADGLDDESDACPLLPGVAANRGCPDVDSDADGTIDRSDLCPSEPEDHDDFQDDDGCPDPDNDGDGVADRADACSLVAGAPAEQGCPAKDTDLDGVIDVEDNCPFESGTKDNAGCLESEKQFVQLRRDELELREAITFESNRSAITKKSMLIADHVAQLLGMHPEIVSVLIALEEPSVTPLTIERSNALKAYLVRRGVAPRRLRVSAATTLAITDDRRTFPVVRLLVTRQNSF